MKRLNSILWGMALVDVVYHCSCGDCDYRYDNEVFEGAELNAVFGGIVSVLSGFAVASGDKDVVGEMKTYAVTKTVAGNFPPPIFL